MKNTDFYSCPLFKKALETHRINAADLDGFMLKNDMSDSDMDALLEFLEKENIEIEETASSDKAVIAAESEDIGDDFNITKQYMKELSRYPLLAPDEELELGIRISEGDEEAKNKLVNSNLRLVINIAKKFTNRGMEFLDLVSEGNIGLMKAADKFDFTKGFKFSTYATWWIRQSISRAIADKSKTVRTPVHVNEKIVKIKKTSAELSTELGREPTIREIAAKLGKTEDEISYLLSISGDTISLDMPVGDEEDATLGDFIEDKNPGNRIDSVENKFLREALFKALHGCLSARESKVIVLRFGLDDGIQRTLEEVGDELHVTRERIRQIEAKALRKLRHPSRSKMLKEFLYDT